MHDWTLVSLIIDWEKSTLVIKFLNNNSLPVDIIFKSIKYINIPKWDEWGESVSVNKFNLKNDATYKNIEIEMQSGDIINIIAMDVIMPR